MALEGGEGSASQLGRSLPPGKTRYPLYRRLGGPQGRSGQVRKISPPPRFDPRTVQPVASRYTDYATRPTICHDLSLSSPLPASSNSLSQGLPSCRHPFGLQFSIIFGILSLFILVTWRSRFHLYPLSFSSTGSTFKLFQNFLMFYVLLINNKLLENYIRNLEVQI